MAGIIDRIVNDLQERYNAAKNILTKETVILYSSLILILILAFLLRILSSLRYEIILAANDPFSQLKVAEYIEENGLFEFFRWVDPQTWYPEGRYWGKSQYIGTPLSAVLLHQFILLLGLNIPIETVAYYHPAIFGSLSTLAIYFVGKEVGNKKVGLLASLLLAVSVGFIQRTSAGFFDNEALGLLLMIIAIYFYLRSLKAGSLTMGVIAGIFLGFLGSTWGASTYLFNLLSLHAFVLIIARKHSDRLTTAFSSTIITGLFLQALVPRNGPGSLLTADHIVPLGMLLIILTIDLYQYLTTWYNFEIIKRKKNIILPIGAGIFAIIGFVLLLTGVLTNISSKFLTTIFPFVRDTTPILKSVSEHQIVTWATFFRNANVLILLLPLGAYYVYQKPTERNIFLLLFTLTTTYFAGSMVRLAIIMAPATALMAAKVVDQTLLPFVLTFQDRFALSKRKTRLYQPLSNEHTAIAFIIIGLFLAFSVGVSTDVIVKTTSAPSILTIVPNPDQSGGIIIGNDWQEAIAWLDYNTDPTADVIASWWDYGYWISTNSNTTILVDNATINKTKIGNVGCMLVLNPRESLKIAKIYDVTYIVVLMSGGYGYAGFDSDIGKVPWFVRIGENSGNIVKINSSDYLQYDSRGQYIEKYIDKFYDSVFWALMTQGVTQDAYDRLLFYRPLSDEAPQSVSDAGFHGEYEEYQDYYELAYETTHNWVRIWRIKWEVIPENAIAP